MIISKNAIVIIEDACAECKGSGFQLDEEGKPKMVLPTIAVGSRTVVASHAYDPKFHCKACNGAACVQHRITVQEFVMHIGTYAAHDCDRNCWEERI